MCHCKGSGSRTGEAGGCTAERTGGGGSGAAAWIGGRAPTHHRHPTRSRHRPRRVSRPSLLLLGGSLPLSRRGRSQLQGCSMHVAHRDEQQVSCASWTLRLRRSGRRFLPQQRCSRTLRRSPVSSESTGPPAGPLPRAAAPPTRLERSSRAPVSMAGLPGARRALAAGRPGEGRPAGASPPLPPALPSAEPCSAAAPSRARADAPDRRGASPLHTSQAQAAAAAAPPPPPPPYASSTCPPSQTPLLIPSVRGQLRVRRQRAGAGAHV